MTQAFVYVWRHELSQMWYLGSRTAKGCYPEDGYICSSRIVKPLILANPEAWTREIISQGTPAEMRILERELLDCLDARNDPRSFNRNNGGAPQLHTGNIPWNKGIKTGSCPEHSERMKGRTPPNKGKKMGPSWNKGLPKEQQPKFGKPSGMLGKTQSELQKSRARDMCIERNQIRKDYIYTCAHCEWSGSRPHRYHGKKCKNNNQQGGNQ